MKKFNEYHKELQFIAENLVEWPEGNASPCVYLRNTSIQICFYTDCSHDFKAEFDFFSTGVKFTKQQWQEARNAYLREQEENNTPKVGDLVDVYHDDHNRIQSGCKLLYVGAKVYLIDVNGSELAYPKSRYSISLHKPKPTIQDQMLEDWKKCELANAQDTYDSASSIGYVFDVLALNGWRKTDEQN